MLTCGSTAVTTYAAPPTTSVVFHDKNDFLANALATTDMPIPLPDEGLVIGGTLPATSYTLGSFTFSLGAGASELYVGANGASPVVGGDWTPLHAGPDIAISGIDSLNTTIALGGTVPVFSFGFDIVEPTSLNLNAPVGGFIDSRFEVRVYDGAALVDSFQFEPANDVLTFAGIWTSVPFDSVAIEEVVGAAENEFFGHFYVGAVAVPEPAPITLLGLGSLALAMGRRRT